MNRFILMIVLVSQLASNVLYAQGSEANFKGKAMVNLTYYKDVDLGCSLGKKAAMLTVGALFMGGGIAYAVDNCFAYRNIQHTDSFETSLGATIVQNNNERISLFIDSDNRKKCEGLSLQFIGEDNGFGGYDLYQDREGYIQGDIIGSVDQVNEELRLKIENPFKYLSNGNGGETCSWNFDNGLKLKLVSGRSNSLTGSSRSFGPRK